MSTDLHALKALLTLLREHDVFKFSDGAVSIELGPNYSKLPLTVNDGADKEQRKQVIIDELKEHLNDDEALLSWST